MFSSSMNWLAPYKYKDTATAQQRRKKEKKIKNKEKNTPYTPQVAKVYIMNGLLPTAMGIV